jgi:isopentenyl diphosphate isomerase/L-lactate dehydrogenase-like FMN-dependent dehydrogenase
VQTALFFGASRVLAARPFITALITGGQPAMEQKIQMMLSAR